MKLGEAGALALADGKAVHQAARRVQVVDTVGAGDAFVAGYLVERGRGATVEERLATAVACGTIACLSPGDWEGAAYRADLVDLEDRDPVLR